MLAAMASADCTGTPTTYKDRRWFYNNCKKSQAENREILDPICIKLKK